MDRWIIGPHNRGHHVWRPGEVIVKYKPFNPPSGAPINSTPPSITGTLGVGNILACNAGVWVGAGITYVYTWRRGGVDIPGASGASNNYTQVIADIGEFIDCEVIATNLVGSTSAFSNIVGPVPGAVSLVDFDVAPTLGSLATATPISGGWQIDVAAGSNGNSVASWACNLPFGVSYTLTGNFVSPGGMVETINCRSAVNQFLTTNQVAYQNIPPPGAGVPVVINGAAIVPTADALFIGFRLSAAGTVPEMYQVTNLQLVAT